MKQEWQSLEFDRHKKTEYIKKSTLDLTDLGLDQSPKYKLLVQLKLLPRNINKKKAKKFVCSLIKAVDYEECLLIEIDDHVARLIGSDLFLIKKTVTGIIKESDFNKIEQERIQTEERGEKNPKSIYSNFHRLIVIEDHSTFQIHLNEGAELFKCEIEVVKKQPKQNSRSHPCYLDEPPKDNDDDGGDDDDDDGDDGHCSVDDTGNTTECCSNDNDDYYDEDSYCSDDDDDETDDYGSQISWIMSNSNGDSPIEGSAELLIEEEACSTTDEKHLLLKKASHVDTLRKHIYEATIKHYNLYPNDVKTYYLSLALNKVDKKLISEEKSILKWGEANLKEVLQVIITDSKTEFLEQLLDGHDTQSKVKKILEKITAQPEQPKEDEDDRLTYIDFLITLTKVDVNYGRYPPDCFLKLFMEAIMNDQWKASLYYWTKLNHLIGTSLLAQYVLEQNLENEYLTNRKEKYNKYISIYQKAASDILTSCYKKNWKWTWYLLVKNIPEWNESCITKAMKMENKKFLQQQPCTDVNSVIWSNYLGEDLDLMNVLKLYGIKQAILSPKARCRMDMFSYLLFLTAYSILLVTKLNKTTYHWLEGVVMAYIAIFIVKEFDQCFKRIRKSPRQCWYYIIDPFNILDQLSITIACIAWALRWLAYFIPEEDRLMIAARYLLCLDFMLYMFRFLEFFYQNKFLGPMLVVIRHMVKTYINFLLILTIFLVAYSVVSESILSPEKELKADIFHKLFRKGFWAMMGEYFLDEIEDSSEDCWSKSASLRNIYFPENRSETTDCANGLKNVTCAILHSANNTFKNKNCPTEYGRYFIPVLLGAYVLFVQILMFNLLIALFNNAISENELQRDMIWRYQRFQLTMQYAESRFLLPPFLPLFFFLNRKAENPFQSNIPEGYIALKDFERSVALKTIHKINKGSYGKSVLDTDKKRRGSAASVNTQTSDKQPNVSGRNSQHNSSKLQQQEELAVFTDDC